MAPLLLRLATALLLTLPTVALAAGAEAEEEPRYTSTASCAWARSSLDVHILPPTHPSLYVRDPNATGAVHPLPYGTATAWDDAHAQAAKEGVEAWERAMHAYAAAHPEAAHLALMDLNVTIVSPDTPLSELAEPDVRVVFSPWLTYAAGLTSVSCSPSNSLEYCPEDQPNTCYIGGTNILLTQWHVYSMTLNDTYSIALHEFGHALGLQHITDPPQDAMNGVYPHPIGDVRNPRLCASTLNLAQLAVSYAWVGGAPYRYTPASASIPQSAYAFVC